MFHININQHISLWIASYSNSLLSYFDYEMKLGFKHDHVL